MRNLLGKDPGQGLRTAILLLSMSTSVTYTKPAALEFSSSCARVVGIAVSVSVRHFLLLSEANCVYVIGISTTAEKKDQE